MQHAARFILQRAQTFERAGDEVVWKDKANLTFSDDFLAALHTVFARRNSRRVGPGDVAWALTVYDLTIEHSQICISRHSHDMHRRHFQMAKKMERKKYNVGDAENPITLDEPDANQVSGCQPGEPPQLSSVWCESSLGLFSLLFGTAFVPVLFRDKN